MKRFLNDPFVQGVLFFAFILALLVCVHGCAGQTTLGTEVKFNNVAAPTLVTVTTARKATTAALLAGKITIAQDKRMQSSLDLVVASLKAAQALNTTDPAQATALAQAAAAKFAEIQGDIP